MLLEPKLKASTSASHEGIVKLNVGGKRYYTTMQTLSRCGKNFFTSLFSDKFPVLRDEEGFIFVDRDGKLFAPLLNYLRTGTLIVNKENLQHVLVEAEYYSIDLSSAFMGNLKEGLFLQDMYTNFLCIQRHPERPWCFGVSGLLNDKPLLTELFFCYNGVLSNTTNDLHIVLNHPDKILIRQPHSFEPDTTLTYNLPLDPNDWTRAPLD